MYIIRCSEEASVEGGGKLRQLAEQVDFCAGDLVRVPGEEDTWRLPIRDEPPRIPLAALELVNYFYTKKVHQKSQSVYHPC